MAQTIRDITSDELRLFGDIIARLERLDDDREARSAVFLDIVRLVRADFGASYVWNEKAQKFHGALIHNMDPDNIRRYEEWFQFRDPHTFQLRAKRRAALVEEVTPYPELKRTEFYNDFLRRDGLDHGVNIFLFDGTKDLGDFRLWRAARSPEFSNRETKLLDALAPFLRRALLRETQRFSHLTERERQVAVLVAKGLRDRDISSLLGIGFSTVRTHVNRAMEKKGCANRAELAVAIIGQRDKSSASQEH